MKVPVRPLGNLLASALLLLAGLAASVWAWRSAALEQQLRADREFDRFAAFSAAHVEQALQRQLDLLAAFQLLFRAEAEVSPADFRRLYDDLRVGARLPGVQALQFARAAGGDGQADPVLAYAVPASDPTPDALQPEVTERARDSGQPQASSPLGAGVYLMRMPVYQPGLPLATADQRRSAWRGQISARFQGGALLQAAVDAGAGAEVQLTLTDEGRLDAPVGAAPERPEVLATALASTAQRATAEAQDLRRHTLAHGGRLWSLQLQRPPVASGLSPLPLLLLGCGIGLSVLLAVVVARLNGMRLRAFELAEQWSAEARQTARRLDAVLDSTVDGVLTLDAAQRIVAANHCTQGILGLDRADLVGRTLGSLLAAGADGEPVDTRAWPPGSQHTVQALRADGTHFPLALTLAAADTGGQQHLVATLRDLTEARAAEEAIEMTMQALQQATELHETMLRHATFAIVMTDAAGAIRACNPAAEQLLQMQGADLRDGMSVGRLVDAEDLSALAERLAAEGCASVAGIGALTAMLGGRDSAEHELHLRRADGQRVPVSLTVTALPADGGADGGFLFIFYDVTERRQLAAQMSRLAYSDGLTGLPNRMQLERDLQAALAAADRRGHGLALLFIDLDSFKPINDTHGHAMGDRVLCEVARRLQGALRATDITARIGGDEFVVLLPALKDATDCVLVAEKLLATLAEPMRLDGQTLTVGASIGLVTYPQGGHDAESLLRQADAAMYAAKQAGRNGYRVVPSAALPLA